MKTAEKRRVEKKYGKVAVKGLRSIYTRDEVEFLKWFPEISEKLFRHFPITSIVIQTVNEGRVTSFRYEF